MSGDSLEQRREELSMPVSGGRNHGLKCPALLKTFVPLESQQTTLSNSALTAEDSTVSTVTNPSDPLCRRLQLFLSPMKSTANTAAVDSTQDFAESPTDVHIRRLHCLSYHTTPSICQSCPTC
ncbi:hypothetical protein TREES_T100015852 [Tupaia chinensis]|uniref:Uncharacterized protein n=1 Tax=Tupaia chinensis TaxID=246437 RepID=L9L633_TUPCH|nr:hypothetical protein TREES_T100015852 [Tupaia chinensis]